MSAKGFTSGPLTIRISREWPFDIQTIDERGVVVFVERMPCGSSRDKTPDDAINAKHFKEDARESCREANRRAIADARIRASAPTLLEALTLAASKPLAQHCTDEEWEFIRSAIMGAQGEQV